MNRYSFQVNWSQEDQVFVACSPEFEGVSGFGETPADALAEAQVSLELALETYREEGWSLPSPRERTEYSGQFRQRIPQSLHRRLSQRAEEEGVSLNTLVTTFIERGLRDEESRDLLQKELLSLRALTQSGARPIGSSAVQTTGPTSGSVCSTAVQTRRGN